MNVIKIYISTAEKARKMLNMMPCKYFISVLHLHGSRDERSNPLLKSIRQFAYCQELFHKKQEVFPS